MQTTYRPKRPISRYDQRNWLKIKQINNAQKSMQSQIFSVSLAFRPGASFLLLAPGIRNRRKEYQPAPRCQKEKSLPARPPKHRVIIRKGRATENASFSLRIFCDFRQADTEIAALDPAPSRFADNSDPSAHDGESNLFAQARGQLEAKSCFHGGTRCV